MANPRKRILVVEDEQITALYLEHILENFGCDVIASVDRGELAVSSTIEKEPEIILMDIVLQGYFDGIEATARIIEHFKSLNRHCPKIIFVTSNSDSKTKEKALSMGDFVYIIKPINPKELKKAIFDT